MIDTRDTTKLVKSLRASCKLQADAKAATQQSMQSDRLSICQTDEPYLATGWLSEWLDRGKLDVRCGASLYVPLNTWSTAAAQHQRRVPTGSSILNPQGAGAKLAQLEASSRVGETSCDDAARFIKAPIPAVGTVSPRSEALAGPPRNRTVSCHFTWPTPRVMSQGGPSRAVLAGECRKA